MTCTAKHSWASYPQQFSAQHPRPPETYSPSPPGPADKAQAEQFFSACVPAVAPRDMLATKLHLTTMSSTAHLRLGYLSIPLLLCLEQQLLRGGYASLGF